jgi:iron complex outermembrane receptor protein
VAGVSVTVSEVNVTTVTGPNGRYTLTRIPAGPATVLFRWPGFQPHEARVDVVAGQTVTLDVALEASPIPLGEIVVSGASRTPERVVEAPAAVSVVEPQVLEDASVTGQVGVALATVPGVDITQSGMNDYNINARGFNSTLNRRILVLQDGRDLAIAFLGAQEWNGLAQPLEDFERVEMVRGPGSALYGANAFSGVLALTTPAARQVRGTKVTLGAGELESFRADLRHAGVLGDGRWGYRLNGGYSTSDTYSRSRTNPGSLANEYEDATDEPVNAPSPGFELRPLNGQSVAAPGQAATGERDAVKSAFGSGRIDYYASGSVITAEGGASQVQNEVFVTGIGRVQVSKALKPYARLGWAADRFNLMAWYTGRDTKEPQYSLASGAPLDETSAIYHIEGQTNHPFLQERGRFVVGASYRQYNVDTDGTLMAPANDDRSDDYYSAYGQLEYRIVPQLRAVVAGRYDDGTLFDGQFSPKAALVFSPNDNHSFRASVNRAFQMPNYSEFFLRAAAGAPANFEALEAGLRAHPQLGPALAGVPNGELFGGEPGLTSSAVRVFALGNADLDVEKVTGYEIGYKGNIGRRAYVGIDLYRNELTDFVTDLLPGVNPTYGAWTAPQQVPAQARQALEDAVRQQLLAAGQTTAALGLTRVGQGTAIVVSYTNEGKVDEQGVEISAGVALTDEFSIGASYSYFDFDVESQQAGDQLLPNTPEHKATFTADYRGGQGIDVGVAVRLVDGYQWAAGVFNGYVPAAELVNVTVGYRINNYVRVHAIATNVFDQQRFQMFGGSVIGRRILGGVTATF